MLALALALVVLALAGVSVDLWRVLAEHERLAAAADAAAVAGAGGIDVPGLYAGDGQEIALDPGEATRLACAYLEAHGGPLPCPGEAAAVAVESGSVTVRLRSTVRLSLLRLLLPGGSDDRIDVEAAATAAPFRRAAPEGPG